MKLIPHPLRLRGRRLFVVSLMIFLGLLSAGVFARVGRALRPSFAFRPNISLAPRAATPAAAFATITVDTLADEDNTNPGNCSLREAITAANTGAAYGGCTAGSGMDTITIAVTGTITLGSALPAIAHPNLTINGPGASSLTISGNDENRVLSIAGGSYNVNISGLTLSDGYSKGADTTAASGTNIASDGTGAGLYSLSSGTVNVTDCVITNNTAQGGNATGGTTVVGGSGRGAGIYLGDGTNTLTRCIISNNSALGGLGKSGTSNFDGTGYGAGVYKNFGSLTVTDCTIADNITDRIDGSVLSGFTAAQGAGLYNASGALSVTGSTFSGNRRPLTLTLQGAAITNQGNNTTITLTNSTFSGNIGSNTIAQISSTTTLTMVNCTVANNTLATSNVSAGAIFVAGGSTLNLKNTVLGNNTDGPNVRKFGTVTSQGNNFDSDGTTTFTNGVNDDIVGSSGSKKDPKLSALGNHGGLTKTQVPLPDSQLLNAGTSSGAPATDQRGIARPQGSDYDIGAVEAQTFALTIVGGNNQNTTVGTQFPTALQVNLKEGTNNIQGAPISYVAPGGGGVASTSPTSGTATTNASGNASYTATANTVSGGYNVSAFIGTLVRQFALTNNPGAAVNFLVSAPSSATLGSAFNFTVTAKDAFNNIATGYGGTVQFTSSDPVATLPSNSTLTNGTGMVSATLNTINNQTLTARDTVTSSITGTSGNIFVSLGVCPMTFTVNDTGDTTDANLGNGVCADSMGKCTLRAALAEANALTSCAPLTINITATGTITLGSDLPTIVHPNLTINGPGANQVTVDGASAYRPFSIGSGNYAVTLAGLKVANGRGNGGGGLFNQSTGTVNVNNVAFTSNKITATSGGGAIRHASSATLNVTGSTFVSNDSTGTGGGGISNFSTGTVNATNCTFSGNLANLGGGIHTQSTGITNITNCTFVSNGGGIRNNSGTVTVTNTIAVGNGTDISGTVTATNNLTGTLASALLGTLGNYGGTTDTFPLLPGSPAINAGTSSGAPATDQRGVTRDSNVDIGAFESRGFTLAVNDGNNQSTTAGSTFTKPLSVTVTSSNSEPVNGGQVTFTPPGSGATATIAGSPATISGGTATTGTVTANLTIGGPYNVMASANGASSINFALTNANSAPTFTPATAISRQQGSPAGAAVAIGTVNDAQTLAGSLIVTQIAGGTAAGITATNITNTNGAITAQISAACGATAGTVRFQVSDGDMTGFGFFQVNLTPNDLPTLSYNSVALAAGGATTNSPTTASDNGSIDSYSVFAQGTYTGAVSVNAAGVVSFSSAAPAGMHSITIRATDNCGATKDATFTVTVSCQNITVTPPAISNATFNTPFNQSFTQAGAIGTAKFTLDSGTLPNGLNLAMNGVLSGTPTQTGTFPLTVKVTDSNNCTGVSNKYNLIVNAPNTIPFTVGLSDPIACTGENNILSVHAEVTNPNNVAANLNFNAVLPAQLTGVAGSCLSSFGTCTVNNASVTVTGNLPANQTVTIDYKVRVTNGTPQGTQLCVDSTASLNGGAPAMVQACTILNCPPNPANVQAGAQKAGSVLVFPYYVADSSQRKDTRLTISNIGAQSAFVHLFFIDGTSCHQADQFVCLTPNASTSFKASEYDPETTGWLLVVAVNSDGVPIQNNALIGSAFVNDGAYAGSYAAEAFRANSAAVAVVQNQTATLFFDGNSYDAAPSQFAVEVQSPVDAAGQRLVSVALQGDLTTGQLSGANQVGVGQAYNGNETPFGSFSNFLLGKCQAMATITATNPRVPNGMNVMIPTGQIGTLKFNIGAGVGLLMTPRTAPWRGIRGLHKTAQTTATLVIPVFRPVC